MSKKESLISEIEQLYPPDSPCDSTRAQGGKLLLEAIETSGFDWRNLPTSILEAHLNLCKNLNPPFNISFNDD